MRDVKLRPAHITIYSQTCLEIEGEAAMLFSTTCLIFLNRLLVRVPPSLHHYFLCHNLTSKASV